MAYYTHIKLATSMIAKVERSHPIWNQEHNPVGTNLNSDENVRQFLPNT